MRLGPWFVVTSVALGGCQTFVGIDDVAGHLPYVDGEYLIGLQRLEADGDMPVIRLRGTATLDPDTRALALSLSQLSATTGATVQENGIADLVFAEELLQLPREFEGSPVRKSCISLQGVAPTVGQREGGLLLQGSF